MMYHVNSYVTVPTKPFNSIQFIVIQIQLCIWVHFSAFNDNHSIIILQIWPYFSMYLQVYFIVLRILLLCVDHYYNTATRLCLIIYFIVFLQYNYDEDCHL